MTGSDLNSWLELSYEERITLAYGQKPAALVSCLTSTWVAICIFRDQQKMSKMYHRLALGMCICNAINALFAFLTSWAIPYDTPGCIHAVGTIDTCTVAGFMNHNFMFSAQYYYISLSIYVFMALRCEFRIKEIEWIEKYLHVGVFILPLTSAIYIASQNMFNPIGMGCWINSAPQGCDIPRYGPCTRGSQDPTPYILLFGVLPTMFNLISATLIIIACYVNEQRKYKSLMTSGCLKGKMVILERARRKKSMLIVKQGTCYLAIYLTSYIFPLIAAVVQTQTKSYIFPTLLLSTIAWPLDGFFFTLSYLFLLSKNKQRPQIRTNQSTGDCIDGSRHQSNQSNVSQSSNTGSGPFRRQSWCVSSERSDSIATGRRFQSRRSLNISLFDGTDKEKWDLFGIYTGPDSENMDDCKSSDEEVGEEFGDTFQNSACADTDNRDF